MKNILTEALVNSATNASFIFSYTNSAKLRKHFLMKMMNILVHVVIQIYIRMAMNMRFYTNVLNVMPY